jgi:hypothetical protein
MTTTLRTDPKMQWKGNSVWDPYSWSWATEGVATADEGGKKGCRLLSVHHIPEKDGGSALQLLIGLERTCFSTVLRLDDSARIPELFRKLSTLQGFSLKEIGEAEF